MKRQIWLYLILAYAIAWLIWITAEHFGVGPDRGEYFALVILFAVAVIFADHMWRRLPCASPDLS